MYLYMHVCNQNHIDSLFKINTVKACFNCKPRQFRRFGIGQDMYCISPVYIQLYVCMYVRGSFFWKSRRNSFTFLKTNLELFP